MNLNNEWITKQDGVIQTIGSPRTRFKEDPIRILKIIKYATTRNLGIENLTLRRIKDMGYSLQRVSKEELVQELNKILQSDNVYKGLKMLWEYRIFNFIIPELAIQWNYDQNSQYHDLQLWEHTAKVVESARQAGEPINILWGCLLHDSGKPFVRTDKWKLNDENIVNPSSVS